MVTLPERMQPVQTFICLGVPLTTARTCWMFGFQRRLVRRCENETFMPNDGFLPQISQTDAMMNYLPGHGRLGATGLNRMTIVAFGPMTSPLTLSPRELRSTIATYADLLRSHKDVINRLNVYPVPDGDTGTNMTLTIESVAAELGPLADDAEMSEVCKAIAHGSLMGARGNSGVILSQMLRGLVAKFPLNDDVSAGLLADSFENADVLARQAVVRIVEGSAQSRD